jgi:hypothetical protein
VSTWRPWSIGWARALPGVINASAGPTSGTAVFTMRRDAPQETYDAIEAARPRYVLVEYDVRDVVAA